MAGLSTIPLVFGVVSLSITSGIIVSKTGKYLHFLYIGSVISITGIAATSFLDQNSPQYQQILFLLLIGVGAGSIIQIKLIALQVRITFSMPFSKLIDMYIEGICKYFRNCSSNIGVPIL